MADISKINGYNVKDAEARSDIAGMKDGTITVKESLETTTARLALEANHASSADRATTASNYTASSGTIATKFNEIDSSIGDINIGVVTLKTSLLTLAGLINDGIAAEEGTINKYKTGDMLFMKGEEEPDYWVTGIEEQYPTLDDESVTESIDGKTRTIGYWKITEMLLYS